MWSASKAMSSLSFDFWGEHGGHGWLVKGDVSNDGGFMFNAQDNIAIKGVYSCPFLCGGPGAVVKAACLESRRSRVRIWPSSFKEIQMFLPYSLVTIQHCGEPPSPRGSMLGLRPSGTGFWILCLGGGGGGRVISFISSSFGGSPGPV